MATMEEQETIVVAGRLDDFVSIYTSNTHDLAYFRKTEGFELVREYLDADGTVTAADFQAPASRVNYRKILRRKMSDEQRAAAAERLARARSSQNHPGIPNSPTEQ